MMVVKSMSNMSVQNLPQVFNWVYDDMICILFIFIKPFGDPSYRVEAYAFCGSFF